MFAKTLPMKPPQTPLPLLRCADDFVARFGSMRIDPELTWHTGNSVFLEVKDQLGNIAKIQMPEIYTLKFHSALTLRAGSILFTAALSPKDQAGLPDLSRKVMVFVKADVVP